MFDITIAIRRQLPIIWSGQASGKSTVAQSVAAVLNGELIVLFWIAACIDVCSAPGKSILYA